MEPMTEEQELLAQIQAKRDECDALYRELDQSLEIKAMIPTAFDHGSVRIKWFVGMAPYPSREREIKSGVLIDGNGVEHPLPADAAERLGVTAQDMKEEWKVSR